MRERGSRAPTFFSALKGIPCICMHCIHLCTCCSIRRKTKDWPRKWKVQITTLSLNPFRSRLEEIDHKCLICLPHDQDDWHLSIGNQYTVNSIVYTPALPNQTYDYKGGNGKFYGSEWPIGCMDLLTFRVYRKLIEVEWSRYKPVWELDKT